MTHELKLLEAFRQLRNLGENIAHMSPLITKTALDEVCADMRDAYDAILKERGASAAEAAWKEQHDAVWPEAKP